MKTKVHLFGMLAEEAKHSLLEIENVNDTEMLLNKIKEMYPAFKNFKFVIAVNKKVIHSKLSINENDVVALLPPYAGG
jgi:molybdopterin converting factor small subunit